MIVNKYAKGGGSGSGVTPEDVQRQIDSALTPYWESAQTESAITEAVSGLATEEYVQEAISGISLEGYWTSAETKDYVDEATEDFITSAYTGFALAEDVEDFERVTASALTELHDQVVELSGDTPDLSDYWTSAQTEEAITEATARFSAYTPTSGFATVNGSAITNGGNIVIQGGGGDMSAYWTSAETKTYVDSAITQVQDQLDTIDEVIPAAIVDLNEKIAEISGETPDLSDYWTSAQTQDAISAATSGKADAANVAKNTSYMSFPKWNEQGIITGAYNTAWTSSYFYINGNRKEPLFARQADTQGVMRFYIPETSGNPGEILVSTGNGAPVWSAVTMGGVSQEYVDSAITQVQDQLDTIDEVIPAAIVDINNRMVSSTSVSTIWRGTAAEYDDITTKDPNTLYIIVNE